MKLENLELIGVHIKKTGGMSFKAVLKDQFENKYHRINLGPNVPNREEIIREKIKNLPQDTRVIHGHFHYLDMIEVIESNPAVPVVTWLRDPVQRMVSYYYDAKRKYDSGRRAGKDFLADISLLEYLSKPARRNGMSLALDGVDLADLTFVGLLEHADEDMKDLISIFDWKNAGLPENNSNTRYKARYPAPSDEELNTIAEFNQKDIELYNYALELRKARLAKS